MHNRMDPVHFPISRADVPATGCALRAICTGGRARCIAVKCEGTSLTWISRQMTNGQSGPEPLAGLQALILPSHPHPHLVLIRLLLPDLCPVRALDLLNTSPSQRHWNSDELQRVSIYYVSTYNVLLNIRCRLVELIVLNVGFQAGILDHRTFSMFVLHAIVVAFIATPLMLLWYPERVRTRVDKGMRY